jgi:hypothetical protein
MNWAYYVSYFWGGLFLSNAVPHVVSGMMGRPFQSPFAKPPGEGLSSSTVNALWGWSNVAVGYWLVCQVGSFDLHNLGHVAAAGFPGFASSTLLANRFGRFNGGNDPLAVQHAAASAHSSTERQT